VLAAAGNVGKVVGGVAVAAATGYGAMTADKQRKDFAPKQLANTLVGRLPCDLQKSEVSTSPRPC
jgi:hypothetical protein